MQQKEDNLTWWHAEDGGVGPCEIAAEKEHPASLGFYSGIAFFFAFCV